MYTGGRQLTADDYLKLDAQADEMYEAIRNSTTDIADIAKQTGLPEWKIKRIKEHVFIKEHELRFGTGTFDSDYEIASAWERLQNGTHNTNDLDLLNHEYFESKFEGIFNTDYDTAHDAAIQSGRPWKPNKEVE